MLKRVLFMLDKLVFPEATQLVRLDTDRMVGLVGCDPLDGDIGESEARNIVQTQH